MKKDRRFKLLTFAIFLTLLVYSPSMLVFSQVKRNKQYDNYIETHKKLAMDHMKKYKIPASITLAQGVLESGAGQGRLAKEANNHFGIKCHTGWNGKTIYKDDDAANECFRSYKRVEDSYEDHSRFLADRPRYSSLFSLDVTDYIGWAKGLQKSGYATDKAYANKLIKLIEDYELYTYDRGGRKIGKDEGDSPTGGDYPKGAIRHTLYKTHNLVYVIAQLGDSYETIAAEFGFKPKDMYKYNEVPAGFPIKEGDIVYFQKKKSKADKPYYDHVVQVGESMHSISQRYGMKIKNLYKMNKKDYEYVPVEGDVLKLR